MMSCNSQAANCQTACVILAPALASPTTLLATGTGKTGTLNATANTACVMGCTTSQLACQTTRSLLASQILPTSLPNWKIKRPVARFLVAYSVIPVAVPSRRFPAALVCRSAAEAITTCATRSLHTKVKTTTTILWSAFYCQ